MQPYLKTVNFAVGDVLCETGRGFGQLIFPTTAIVSMLCLTVEGDSAEVAMVGHDGVVGYTSSPVAGSSNFRWVVQSAGAAYVLDDMAHIGHGLAGEMRRFTQALLAQVAQTAVCNRFHSIEQQLSRRLLMGLDRSSNSSLVMTHESAAMLLGVRREGVSVAAKNLQRAGLIKYRRGHIDILDRDQLELCACECYSATKRICSELGNTRLSTTLWKGHHSESTQVCTEQVSAASHIVRQGPQRVKVLAASNR